jgi:type I restriction-modification system DNA methylase subunit
VNKINVEDDYARADDSKANKQIKIKRSSINFVAMGGSHSSSTGVSPVGANRASMLQKLPANEGMYQAEEGRHQDHKDKLAEQEEVMQFVDRIFTEFPADQKHMTFENYTHIINQVSSEMFLSLMALLHQKLPCAANCFRLKRLYR